MQTETTPAPARPSAGHQFTCVTCEMPIDGKPTFHVGLAFCCAGCAVSGPCTCSYDDRPSAADLAAAARACACETNASTNADADGQVDVVPDDTIDRIPEFGPVGAPEPAGTRHWLATPVPVLTRR